MAGSRQTETAYWAAGSASFLPHPVSEAGDRPWQLKAVTPLSALQQASSVLFTRPFALGF